MERRRAKHLGLVEEVRRGTREAVERHHSLGFATTHQDARGLHLRFPDRSRRYFPACDFPPSQTQSTPHFLRWAHFMKGLFKILSSTEWEHVALRFGPDDQGGAFAVRISPHALQSGHWLAARELARRTAQEPFPPGRHEVEGPGMTEPDPGAPQTPGAA